MSPTKLVERAARLGIKTLALTDINNTSCTVEFIELCRQAAIKPVLGVEFRHNGHLLYIGIARSDAGFAELCRLLDRSTVAGVSLPDRAPESRDCYFVYNHLPCLPGQLMPNEFLGIRRDEVYSKSRLLGMHLASKGVVWQPVTLEHPDRYKIHRILQAIGQNKLLPLISPHILARPDEYLIEPDNLKAYYQSVPAVWRNTMDLLESCEVSLGPGSANNRSSFLATSSEDRALLESLVREGRARRFTSLSAEANTRIENELQLIYQLGFESYFLTTWDIVRFARRQGYAHVGRGSGANSVVAYCLGITDVDPIELNLYFERFINPYRKSPPDFDIDFSWKDRDDVWNYVLAKYGSTRACILSTYNTFKGKSMVREMGKVFGLSRSDMDVIIRRPMADHLHHPLAKDIFRYGRSIQKFPNHLSMHAGGLIISGVDLARYTARQMMPKGYAVTHFDMRHGEQWGFHKIDLLSQRGLGHLSSASKLIERRGSESVDIQDMVKIKHDVKVKELLKAGKCLGCFYIESPAMRGLLQKLNCETYRQLIAATSIIRPGVARSGMMKKYIERSLNNRCDVCDPLFGEHLKDTFGVMVYQEDVMKMVHYFAGFDLYEADLLRRLMTGKRKSEKDMADLREQFFLKAAAKGHPRHTIKEVWRQIASFSGYAFCKAHSSTYAAESMQSLYLKAHFPLEFIVGVINNFGGFYSTEIYLHEARMMGATVHAPCVNQSSYLTSLNGSDIMLGYIHIKSLRRDSVGKIATARAYGRFRNLRDFMSRVDLSPSQLELLIRVDAFRFTRLSREKLYWSAFSDIPSIVTAPTLFEPGTTLKVSPNVAALTSPGEIHIDEIEVLGFPLCSPFDLLHELMPHTRMLARDLMKHLGKSITMIGYFVVSKPVTTINGKHMCFAAWLDEEGDFFDTVHFPTVLSLYPIEYRAVYLLSGEVISDLGVPSLRVASSRPLQGAVMVPV